MKKNTFTTHARRTITLLLALIMLCLLPACQNASVSSQTTSTTTATTAAATTTTTVTTAAPTVGNPVVRLSTTTSVNDSGLLPELEKVFEAATGYQLEIIANGTGAAIKLGETGDADVLLVHAKASEEAFVEAGFGVKRLPFMHNFFVIAGSAADPAKVAECKDAVSAFKAIAGNEAAFVSRGDDSGTHKAELKIWEQAGIKPAGDWYVSAGKGMGPSLLMADELEAYILTDKATYLATSTELKILLGESTDLKNTYSLIAVNPQKSPVVNAEGAQAWIDFLLGDEARKIISVFGVDKYGEALFIYDGLNP